MKPFTNIAKLKEEVDRRYKKKVIKSWTIAIQAELAPRIRQRYAIRPATPYQKKRHGGMIKYVHVLGFQ